MLDSLGLLSNLLGKGGWTAAKRILVLLAALIVVAAAVALIAR